MTDPSQAKSGRWPTLVLLLVTSLGVPTGVLALLGDEQWIRNHLWLTLGFLAGWEVMVLLGGLVTDIWSKLRSKLVDALAAWADRWITSTFSLFRRRYLKWLFFQHRDFDVKGLSTQGSFNLELEHVFVDLTIEPKPAHSTSTDPIRPVPEKLSGRRQIWDYLRSKDLEDNLVLIGAPGSGKTTLLKKIALHMVSNRRPRLRKTVPVLLFLREHAERIQQDPAYPLAEAVKDSLSRKEGPVPPDGWLERKLKAGQCVVLLDGLDEVAVPEIREKVVAWVESRMKAHPENRFLVTSRPLGYRNNPISGVTVLEVQPFNREQIRRFVHNWYLANEIRASGKCDPGVKAKARDGAEDLMRRLGASHTLTDLAVNPLLLTMIATVHRYRSSLPGRRVELYAEICEVFLGKRQQARGIETELTPSQKQRVLQPLAYHLMSHNKREISLAEAMPIVLEPLLRVSGDKGSGQEERFLKEVETGSGLLLERESQVYSFAHLAFQEYLAAAHAREQGLGDSLLSKVSDSWWHETLRLYGALGDASPVVGACLAAAEPKVAGLSLAIDCVEEAREIDPQWRARIDDLLEKGVESEDPEKFRLAAETLLARRLRSFIPIADGVFLDPTCVTHAEYQLFLEEQRVAGYDRQPDHWPGHRFPSGQARLPVVGIRPSDALAFCHWLSERDAAFQYRVPEAGAEPNALNLQPVGALKGYWSGEDALVLHRIGTTCFLPTEKHLIEALEADSAFALELDHKLELDRLGRARTIAIEHARVLDHELDFDLAIERARLLVVYHDLKVNLVDLTGHVLNLESALSLDLSIALNRDRDSAVDRDRALIHARATLIIILALLKPRREFSLTSLLRGIHKSSPPSKAWEDLVVDFYWDLVILAARRKGIVPAFEGLRLVKERRA